MPSRRPKNQAIVDGEVTYIIIFNTDGSEACRVLVDTDMYQKKLRFGKWRDQKTKDGSPRAIVGTYGILSRVVMEMMTGEPIPEGLEVDHINRNILDNRSSNLRLLTHSQNLQNRKFTKSASGEHNILGTGPYLVCIEYKTDDLDIAVQVRNALVDARKVILEELGIETFYADHS